MKLVVGAVGSKSFLILCEGKEDLCGKSLTRRNICDPRKAISRGRRENGRPFGKMSQPVRGNPQSFGDSVFVSLFSGLSLSPGLTQVLSQQGVFVPRICFLAENEPLPFTLHFF